MLIPFQSIWDGHLGRSSTVKHRVDLESATLRPIDSVSYRAWTGARDLKRDKTESMLEINVIEPAKTE